jgi:hypothetical protein
MSEESAEGLNFNIIFDFIDSDTKREPTDLSKIGTARVYIE